MDGTWPDEVNVDHVIAPVGNGPLAFERLAEGLLTWQLQRRFGFAVFDEQGPSARAQAGATALLSWHLGPARATFGVRVVQLVDEADRKGFVYATLPSHPEIGEESFLARIDASGTVTFETLACSRPGTLLTRLAGPLGRAVQHAAHRRYAAIAMDLAN